jgi:hypothetical protein
MVKSPAVVLAAGLFIYSLMILAQELIMKYIKEAVSDQFYFSE